MHYKFENGLRNLNELTPTNRKVLSTNKHQIKMGYLPNTISMMARKKLSFFFTQYSNIFFLYINLHKHFFCCLPAQSHGAKADCLTLLRITSVLGEEWLNWLNSNCYHFTNCKVMWGQPPKMR